MSRIYLPRPAFDTTPVIVPGSMFSPSLPILSGPQRINPMSPQARGLVAAWPLAAAGGVIARDVGPLGLDGTFTGLDSGDWQVKPQGRVLNFPSNTADRVDVPSHVLAPENEPWSWAARIQHAAQNDWNWVGVLETDGSGQFDIILSKVTGYAGLTFGLGGSTGGASGVAFSTGVPRHYLLTYNGGGDLSDYLNFRLFVDGVEHSLAATGAFGSRTNANYIGRTSIGGNYGVAGWMQDVRSYSIAVPPGLARKVSADPLDLYAPTRLPRYFVLDPWAVAEEESGAYEESVTEGAEAGDAYVATVTFAAALTEGADAGDTPSVIANLQAAIAEGAAASDASSREYTAGPSLTEGADGGDSVAAEKTIPKALTEGVDAGDSSTAELTVGRALSEGVDAGDLSVEYLTAAVSLSEGAVAGDAKVPGGVFGVTLTEGAVAGETYVGGSTYSVSLSEGSLAGDGVAAVGTWQATLSDGVATGDSLTTDSPLPPEWLGFDALQIAREVL